MFSIYFCEDEEKLLEHYKMIAGNYIMIENLDAEIASANNPDALLKLLEDEDCHHAPGLYFLDVNLNHRINGIMLADSIRQADPRGFIVFITAVDSCLPDILELNIEAMNFINKSALPDIGPKITNCIRIAYNRYCSIQNTTQKTLCLTAQDKMFVYSLEEIVCIHTAENHSVAIYTRDSRRCFRGSLNSIEKELDGQFFRCHDSCIVNLNYIREIDRLTNTAKMKNNITCKIACRKMQQLNKLLKARQQE